MHRNSRVSINVSRLPFFKERNWVCVEGLNVKYDLRGKTSDFAGVMVPVEEPLLVTTDIKLVDPSDQQVNYPLFFCWLPT